MKILKAGLKFNGKLEARPTTKYFVVHHSSSSSDDVHSIHRYHLSKSWIGIGYHFVIQQNGDIYEGRPLSTIGAHVQNYNRESVGICVCGNLEVQPMTVAQSESLQWLLKYLLTFYPNAKAAKHKDFMRTNCPGKYFDDALLKIGDADAEHFALTSYKSLVAHGLTIHEKRFDDKITRGEVFVLLAQILKI